VLLCRTHRLILKQALWIKHADGADDYMTELCILSPLERLENPRGERVLPGMRYLQTTQTRKRSLAFAASIAVLGSQSRRGDSSSQTSTRSESTHVAVWKFTGREQSIYSRLTNADFLDRMEYSKLFEVLIIQENLASITCSADLFCHAYERS
jgi:hypothetical protein